MEILSRLVLSMAILRFISGTIEITAGILMLKFNNIERALLINASLAIVGPLVLIISTSIGLIGISERLSFSKISLILAGIFLILLGIKK